MPAIRRAVNGMALWSLFAEDFTHITLERNLGVIQRFCLSSWRVNVLVVKLEWLVRATGPLTNTLAA
jgi:hypothetical protein